MKKCNYCAELIQDEAIKCRYCMEFQNHDSNDTDDLDEDKNDEIIEYDDGIMGYDDEGDPIERYWDEWGDPRH